MSGLVVLVLRVLLAISLYLFLGWAFYCLWRDIKQQGALLASRHVPPLGLSIQHEASEPQIRHYSIADVTIGRDPECECPIDDEAISAHHARLSYHHSQWWLEDLNSTNGTLLNQEILQTPTVIMTEDEFICGETRFQVFLVGDVLLKETQRVSNG